MAKRIKILFTTSNFKTAGSGKVIYDLVKGLDKSKFEIEIACGRDGGEFFKTITELGLPIHVFSTKTQYRPYATLCFRLKRLSSFIRAHKYDIVHSWQWSNDWTEALSSRMGGAKWIYTKKAMGFKSKHWQIKSYLANFIITINDEMRDYFPYKKNQALIPLGIDTDYYNPTFFEIPNDTNTFKIITVANLVPVKGIEVLIKAVHLLQNHSIKLTVLGTNDNAYGDYLKSLCKDLKINHQVTFIQNQPDVRPYIKASDLYVIPTLDEGRKEGMPMALVEAMSMAIPVLGSRISGIQFVLRDFQNLLFNAGDIYALKDSIAHMMDKSIEDRHQLGMSLRQYCKDEFSLDLFINAHERLYNKLITRANV
ncbi:glycosyltransferase [Sediminibacter sp. Hel_I_10]|uniref:glycosyltransferase n=1 Tax=Sediminibacter sp. Hel_I_10 TaxID=1392490 RepID=UPI00047EA2AE|nr:glycosyltransferase [Sediminibacter sp. Hel_I_10]